MADYSFISISPEVSPTTEEAEATPEARFVPDTVEKAKSLLESAQENNGVLGLPSIPEPDWTKWNPTPAEQTLSPALPLEPPPWLLPSMNPAMAWIPPTPAEPLPAGQGPVFDMSGQPTSLLGDAAPAQPTVFYPSGNTETLALRPTDVFNGLKKGGEILMDNGRFALKLGAKILGPIGVLGTIKDVYDFSQWVNKQIPDGTVKAPNTRYDLASNQLLWEQPGGTWTPYPPSTWTG